MTRGDIIEVRGKISHISDGEKRMNQAYVYGYLSITVEVTYAERYSVLIPSSKIDKFGFMPKRNMWVRVKGTLSYPDNELYDPSIKYVKEFEHIEPPLTEQIQKKLRSK